MAKKTSKPGSTAVPAKTTSTKVDLDIDDIFSGKPLRGFIPSASGSGSGSGSGSALKPGLSNEKSKKDKKKKKPKVVDSDVGLTVEDEQVRETLGAELQSVGKGKRKADVGPEAGGVKKKSKSTSSTVIKSRKEVLAPVAHAKDGLDDEDEDEDDFEDIQDSDDEEDTPQVIEIVDPSAISRTKVKAALQPVPGRGRRQPDAEEEMFRDSRGDGPRTFSATSRPSNSGPSELTVRDRRCMGTSQEDRRKKGS